MGYLRQLSKALVPRRPSSNARRVEMMYIIKRLNEEDHLSPTGSLMGGLKKTFGSIPYRAEIQNYNELHTVRFRPPSYMNLYNLEDQEQWFESFLASYKKKLFVAIPLFDDYDVGFLAKLSEAEANEIKKMNGCISARYEPYDISGPGSIEFC